MEKNNITWSKEWHNPKTNRLQMCQEKHVTREQQDGLAIQIPKAADQERIVT